MKDADCVSFLQWCLPRLHMRWDGFRKVRSQVCKRIGRRMDALGLSDLDAYRDLLEREPGEWDCLDAMCRVTISRFYRDRGVFDRLVREVLPSFGRTVRCWCAGCASGEEPYTLAISWQHRVPSSEGPDRRSSGPHANGLRILATDVDAHMLERARIGCYQRGTLKELPEELVDAAFEVYEGEPEPYCLKEVYREEITLRQHDVRDEPPDGPFDLILCRNLVFMYFDEGLQRDCLRRFRSVLRRGGALVIGKHEALPESDSFEPWFPNEGVYRRTA